MKPYPELTKRLTKFERTNEWTNGWTGRWMEGGTDGRRDGWMRGKAREKRGKNSCTWIVISWVDNTFLVLNVEENWIGLLHKTIDAHVKMRQTQLIFENYLYKPKGDVSDRLDYQPLFGKGARAPPPKAIDAHVKISETQLILESYLYKPKGYVSEGWNSHWIASTKLSFALVFVKGVLETFFAESSNFLHERPVL